MKFGMEMTPHLDILMSSVNIASNSLFFNFLHLVTPGTWFVDVKYNDDAIVHDVFRIYAS
jgi:hypothetical protein